MVSVNAPAALAEMKRPDSHFKLVSGHFPLACVDEAVGQWKTFTLLRHPLDRVLSALRRQSDRDPAATVQSIYDNPLRFHLLFDNHMVKMLGISPDEIGEGMFSLVRPEQRHLDRALAALENIDVIGVQEDFDPFCARLEQAFGWNLGERLGVNRTGAHDVPEQLVQRILLDNKLDLALYSHARQLLGLPKIDDVGIPLA